MARIVIEAPFGGKARALGTFPLSAPAEPP
jgi:hypothetical protein